MNLTITGANDLAVVAAKMKRLGEGQLRREMLAGIRKAAAPLIPAAQASARDRLPKAGGLNEIIATSKFAVRTRTTGRSVGVRVVSVGRHDMAALDEGRLRHPVFATGPRETWVWPKETQQITPGFFSDAEKAHADEPRKAVVRVIDDIARRT